MMDELELLKKDWQNRKTDFPALSYEQIHKMLWKKSSSIVKWIFIISIIEFLLPHVLYLVPSFRHNLDIYSNLGLSKALLGLSIVQYSVVAYFIYQFYRRYQEISVLDNAKALMSKIIRTRRTVKHYVIFCLGMILVTLIITILGIYLNPDINSVIPMPTNKPDISVHQWKNIMMWSMTIFGIFFVAFMGGIYFLLYGLLLRKLKHNYKELKKLEV